MGTRPLKEYVLVSSRSRLIEVYRRNEANRWELFEYGPADKAELASVGAAFEVSEVYDDPLAPKG